MSVESSFFLAASLVAAISSLLGRDFLSIGLEEFAGEDSVAFEAGLVSDKLGEGLSSFGLVFMLASGTAGVRGSILSDLSLNCASFCMVVGFEDGFGITGIIGLIAGMVVNLR